MPTGDWKKLNAVPLEQRLWNSVDKSGGPNSCWPWLKSRKADGYGKIRSGSRSDGNRRTLATHRLAFELASGEKLSDAVKVRHTCDNPPCCNPAHLIKGSQRENCLDMVARKRHWSIVKPQSASHGVTHYQAKLDDQKVLDILSSTESNAFLAAKYAVSRAAVRNVRSRITWKHVVE